MNFPSRLSNLTHRPPTVLKKSCPPAVRARRAHCRLTVERLEDRRLLAAGVLDPTFGNDGVVVTSLSSKSDSDRVFDMAIQSDGKIIAVGDTYSGKTGQDFALVRYHSDGALDTTFGVAGKVTTDFNRGSDLAYAVAIQPDGKIIAAGYASTTVKGSYSVNFALARYHSNGSLDTTFGSKGKIVTPVSVQASDAIKDLALQADGRIVVAGYVNSGSAAGGTNFALARYTPAGKLDGSFGSGGIAISDVDGIDIAHTLAILPNGQMIAAGESDNGEPGFVFATARYNANGSLDTSFGSDGKVTIRPGLSGGAYGIIHQADGKIVVGGHALFDDSTGERRSGVGLVRYNSDGSLDDGSWADSDPADSFGVGGLALAYNPSGQGGTQGEWSIALQADGKIVMAGYQGNAQSISGATFLVGRFSGVDGELDTSFGDSGWVTTSFPAPAGATDTGAQGRAVAVQSDGKIIAGGQTYDGTQTDFALARYVGDPLLLAATTRAHVQTEAISASDAQPLLAEALRRWQTAGFDTSGVGNIDIQVANLGGTTLGMASGGTILLDDNAAGWGWFVDATPSDDSEFTTPGNQGEMNRIDLLSVVMHELGHLLGFAHDDQGVMAKTLAVGVRRTGLVHDHVALTDWIFGLTDGHRDRGLLAPGRLNVTV